MADTIILYVRNASGLNAVYLSASSIVPYTGSGTPWDTLATSPFRVTGNSEVNEHWTPTAAPTTGIYAGDQIVGISRDRVSETFGIGIYANTPDRAVALVQKLRQWFNNAQVEQPAQISVLPNTTTNAVYFEVYKADIQETNHFVRTEWKQNHVRVHVTIERSALGGLQGVGTAATFSSATITNSFSANYQAYTNSFTGELIEEGLPINITLSSPSATTMTKLFLAGVDNGFVNNSTYTTSASVFSTTNTTTGLLAGNYSAGGITVTTVASLGGLNGNQRYKPRLLIRFSAVSSNAEVRMGYSFGGSTPVAYGPWINPDDVATVVDFGTIPISAFQSLDNSGNQIYFFIYVRSTDGGSASVTYDRQVFLLYRQFFVIEIAFNANVSSYKILSFNSNASTLRAVLPRPPQAIRLSSSPLILGRDAPRGELPRAYQTSPANQLWLSWLGTGGLHKMTETVSCAVEYAPLYRSFRGAT